MSQPTETKPEQGLAPTEKAKVPEVITTPAEYTSSLLRWQRENYHVLTPFTNFSGLAPQHGIMSSLVQLDLSKDAAEVYDGTETGGSRLSYLKEGEVAIAKNGLRRIAQAAGLRTQTQRTDPRTVLFYWELKAIVSWTDIDGSKIVREATKEWDLRDGSPQLKGFTANQINEARKHGLRNCETRAVNAAIRELGLKQKYTRDELKKPFVALRVSFRPDMSDPTQARMMLEHHLGATSALYPAPATPAPIEDWGTDEPGSTAPRQVGSGSTAQTGQAKATDAPAGQTAPPAGNQPPSASAVKIVKVGDAIKGTTKGRDWTRWDITDSTGRTLGTFSESDWKDACRFRDAGDWVEIDTETRGDHTNIVEITKAGQQPDLPMASDL